VPENVNTSAHNGIAAATSCTFGIMLALTPIALRGMPWSFLLLTCGCLAVLATDVLLYVNESYFNLTAFETVAFAMLFGWISILVRFMAAMLGGGVGEEYETAATAPPAARPVPGEAGEATGHAGRELVRQP